MKQRIRRIWLALCMAVCLFALAGCSAAVDTAETIDPQIEMAMQSGSQQYLDLFNQMDDASIEQALATSVKNKDTVMENALKSWDSIKDDLGAFVSSETAVVTKGDDGYIARMNTVYEKRAMEFTLIADEDNFLLSGLHNRREDGESRNEYLNGYGRCIRSPDLHQLADQHVQIHQRI